MDKHSRIPILILARQSLQVYFLVVNLFFFIQDYLSVRPSAFSIFPSLLLYRSMLYFSCSAALAFPLCCSSFPSLLLYLPSLLLYLSLSAALSSSFFCSIFPLYCSIFPPLVIFLPTVGSLSFPPCCFYIYLYFSVSYCPQNN